VLKFDNRLVVIPFPSFDKLELLANYLNSAYFRNYMIFNFSEYTYSSRLFLNQVVDYCFPGYSCPPLEAAFMATKEIESWLKSDDKNVVVIHCQHTKVIKELNE